MDRARIQKRIRDIAESPKNVRYSELETLLEGHIKPLFPGHYNHHGKSSHHAFTVSDQTFTIAEPKGTPFVKAPYIRNFLNAMEAIGLYKED